MSISLSTPRFSSCTARAHRIQEQQSTSPLSFLFFLMRRVCLVFPLQFLGLKTSDLIFKGMWLVIRGVTEQGPSGCGEALERLTEESEHTVRRTA